MDGVCCIWIGLTEVLGVGPSSEEEEKIPFAQPYPGARFRGG